MKKDELIVKICKKVIVVFGILTAFNFILLISGKSYALFTRTITTNDPVIHIKTADELPGLKLVNEIKSKVVKYEDANQENFSGGVVAINEESNLYNESNSNEQIREYRYNGPTVNNYVTFNDELWRIIGVFKENGKEYTKIVKNEKIPIEKLPESYTIGDTTYDIYNYDSDVIYWNKKSSGDYSNDWTTAGLQYFLNTEKDDNSVNGYLSFINTDAKKMLIDSTYYLGNIFVVEDFLGSGMYEYDSDTTKTVYEHERGNKSCTDTCVGGDIEPGNQATWKGKVGLLYVSDYGFANINSTWEEKFSYGLYGDAEGSISIMKNWIDELIEKTFFISPVNNSRVATYKTGSWYVLLNSLSADAGYSSIKSIYPTLTLSSSVKIIDGDGSQNFPYELSL